MRFLGFLVIPFLGFRVKVFLGYYVNAHPTRAGLVEGARGPKAPARGVRGRRESPRSQSNGDDVGGIQPAHGWSWGCRGEHEGSSPTGDTTATRCHWRTRLDAELAPAAGGIQQGAARPPLAKWFLRNARFGACSTKHILQRTRNRITAQRGEIITVLPITPENALGTFVIMCEVGDVRTTYAAALHVAPPDVRESTRNQWRATR